MKKLILSLTVILASGAYAFAERQSPDASVLLASPTATTLPSGTTLQKLSSGTAPAALRPAATPTPVASTQPALEADAAPAPQPALASIASEAPAPAPVPEAPPVQVAAIDAPAPLDPGARTASDASPASVVPLPRPRPADAPQAPLQTAQVAASQGQYKDGSYTGPSADAYYGRVQVKAVVKGGQVVAVNVLQYPNDRRTSRYINSQALPMLEQEAIQAQSGNVDVVSGATLTSQAYRQSLSKALAGARNGNA